MCPPGVDQTTRGPQSWHILAPLLRQIHHLTPKDPYLTSSPEEDLFNEKTSWDAWSKLARPASRVNLQIHTGFNPATRTKLSELESIPPELLAVIMSCPELSEEDIVSLGLSSETLWMHALRHIEIQCRQASTVAPWAGVEIACTGTYLTDLPEAFTKNDLAAKSVTWFGGGEMCSARKFNWAAISNFSGPGASPEEAWREAFYRACAVSGNRISQTRIADMSRELDLASSRTGPSLHQTVWVLRNLNTKEYVRCLPRENAQGKRGYVDHPRADWLRIDDLLMMRICWSDARLTHYGKGNIDLHGKWAGHCFDIVALDEEKSAIGDGWTDVTDGVVSEAQVLSNLLRHPRQGNTRTNSLHTKNTVARVGQYFASFLQD